MSEKLDEIIIKNAISAYFLLWPLLLLNKSDSKINNTFVRGHARTASILMLIWIWVLFFLDLFSFLWNYDIFWYDFFYILQTITVVSLFATFLYGAFKAYRGETFTIGEIFDLSQAGKIIQITQSRVTNEQDKTSIILSYVPFFGYFLYPQLKKYKSIRSVNKINLYSTLIICLFYTSGRYNTANILLLLYLIYVTFTAITLYAKWEIKILNLEKIWSFEELYIRAKAFCLYLYNYTSRDHRFREYELYLKIEKAAHIKQAKMMLKDLLPRRSIPFPKWILYVPFINIVGIFFLDTRYKTHIINGLCINILLIIIWIFSSVNSPYSIFILFPISYGLAYRRKIDYRFPIIYDIAKIEMKAWSKAKEVVEEVNKKRKKKEEVLFIPKNNKQN